MKKIWDVIIVGSGNAALCAGIAACESGAKVLVIEKADQQMAGGNTKYTAGAMRFVYNSSSDLLPLLSNPSDKRIPDTDFGTYTKDKFSIDLLEFNEGESLTEEQETLISSKRLSLIHI